MYTRRLARSFLDIFTLSGFTPRPLKYVSKIEILDIPLIGWAMRWAGHIAIRRGDRRSQLETFKDTVASLKAGNAVVTFAEGTRSTDGRLANFKAGPFKMAINAGVDIVPVSLVNIWRWCARARRELPSLRSPRRVITPSVRRYPPTALVPIARPRDVEIRVHPVVKTAGRKEEDVRYEVFAAVNNGLPTVQQASPTVVASNSPKQAADAPAPPADP